MKIAKLLTMGAMLAVSLVGAASASASTWDPPNTNVTATQEGVGTLTGSGGQNFHCLNADMVLRASGDLATAQGAHNPVIFFNCSNPTLGAATVTTFGTWTFTATSTTAVDITAVNGASGVGTVATITYPAAGCEIRVPSPVHLAATWSNANHTLSIANGGPIATHGTGLCALAGTTARLDANFVAPAASIT